MGNSAPQGLILLAYTLPSILIRTFVPYIKFPSIRRGILRRRDQQEGKSDDGQVDYSTRLCVCAAASFSGLQMLAWCECVEARVLGIAFASLSSNLGDMWVLPSSALVWYTLFDGDVGYEYFET